MKSVLSIPLILLIFFSGIPVKYAEHYCGGTVFETRISFSGKPATCGMEKPFREKSSQDTFNNYCCNDVISSFSINIKYIPSSFENKDHEQKAIFLLHNPLIYQSNLSKISKLANDALRPPGVTTSGDISLQYLCTFRI